MTIGSKINAHSFVICKYCTRCDGTGFVGVATANNESEYDSFSKSPCSSCVRGFVLMAFTEPEFLKWITERMQTDLLPYMESMLFPRFVDQLKNGPLRPQFFDLLVAEVEQRLKDVESKILDAKHTTPFAVGDTVRYVNPKTPIGIDLPVGILGRVSNVTESPLGHWNVFVHFAQFDADVRLNLSDLEKTNVQSF